MSDATGQRPDNFGDMSRSGRSLVDVLDDLEARSRSFGTALTSALTAGLRDGRSLEDVLRQTALRLSDIALSAGLQPLSNLIGSTASSLAENLAKAGSTPGKSAVPSFLAAAGASAFTADGHFASPAILRQVPMAGGPFGERATAGGVSAPLSTASATAAGAPSIVFNIRTEDAASFRRSEGQIASMLSRTVLRGRRGL